MEFAAAFGSSRHCPVSFASTCRKGNSKSDSSKESVLDEVHVRINEFRAKKIMRHAKFVQKKKMILKSRRLTITVESQREYIGLRYYRRCLVPLIIQFLQNKTNKTSFIYIHFLFI